MIHASMPSIAVIAIVPTIQVKNIFTPLNVMDS